MVKTEKTFLEKREKILKVENENMEIQIIHIKKQLHTIKKKENNFTIEKIFDQDGNKVSMFETVQEVDEEIVTKESNIR